MFVVDTNVLIYAANESSPFHDRCHAWLSARRENPGAWYVTWGIAYEFLHVVTHPRALESPWSTERAWAFVQALLDSPGLGVLVPTERHRAVVTRILDEIPPPTGTLIFDLRTAALMREHGVRRIYTRDTDFHRFPFLEVVDPTIEG